MRAIIGKFFSNKSSQLLVIFGIQGISAFLGFAVQFLLARNLSVEEYGQFSILFNLVAILSLVVSFGSTNHMLRFISIYHEHKNKSKTELQTALFFTCVNWLILSLLALIVNHLIFTGTVYYFTNSIIMLSSLWMCFTALSQLFQNFDRAIGNAIRSMIPNNIIKSVLLILFIFLDIWGFGQKLNLLYVVGMYAMVFLIVTMIYLIFDREYFSLKGFFKRSIIRYRLFMRNSFQYFLNTISQNLLKNLDLIFIGFFLTAYDAGIYGVANRINIVIVFGLASLNILYSPQVAKFFKEKKIEELNKSLWLPNWIIFLFSFFLFTIIIFFGKSILEIFGQSFVTGYWVLIFLSLRNLVESFFGITGSVLNMSGNQKYFNKILYVILAVYIFLSPVAIKLWGIEGLAFFTAIIALGKNFVQWRFIYFKLGIRSGLFSNLFHRFIG